MTEEIEPDRYRTFTLKPGSACFNAEVRWDLAPISGIASREVTRVEVDVKASHTTFLRLEQVPTLLGFKYALRQVEERQADPAIRRCRRLIPLTPDELYRKYSKGTDSIQPSRAESRRAKA
jgi:hypothetical protein